MTGSHAHGCRGELIIQAVFRERHAALRRLLRSASTEDLEWPSRATGRRPLHQAAENRCCFCLRELVTAGAIVDSVDDSGWTALFWAVDADIDNSVQNGDPLLWETVEALLDLGADPYFVAPNGKTPSKIAGAYKCEDRYAALLARRRTMRSS